MVIDRCSAFTAANTFNGAEILALMLQKNSTNLFAMIDSSEGDECEESIKGTMTLYTLAVGMYVSVCMDYVERERETHTAWLSSVLSDLGSAMSITALRMRYRPLKDKFSTPTAAAGCPSLVEMLVNAISTVKESAEEYYAHKSDQQRSDAGRAHHHAVTLCYSTVLRSLPETVLLLPGQDEPHRAPSVDRSCMRSASLELRSDEFGMKRVVELLMKYESNTENQHESAIRMLHCCESWAKYVSVPTDIVNLTIGNIGSNYFQIMNPCATREEERAREASLQYLVAIFDSAAHTLTTKDVLMAVLGAVKKSSSNGKKKTRSKSKKRADKVLGELVAAHHEEQGDTSDNIAGMELKARRNAACVAAALAFGISIEGGSIASDGFGLRPAITNEATTNHMISSTICSVGVSVLPHLLSEGIEEHWRTELIQVVLATLQRLCGNTNRDTRCQAYEPLFAFASSLSNAESTTMVHAAVDSLSGCVLALGEACQYPRSYFNELNLTVNNDDEIEVERNDVRDVARTVCSLDSGVVNDASPSLLVLERIINACGDAIRRCIGDNALPHETAVHILSALAKPLNKLATLYKENPFHKGRIVMISALTSLGSINEKVSDSFESMSMSDTLPISRLACMATASYSPMMSALVEVIHGTGGEGDTQLCSSLKRTIMVSLRQAILSSAVIPELVAESTLSSSRYDIRGAMRGPGGEDHVGILALMRMSEESDNLTHAMFEVQPAILNDFVELHARLKAAEASRGLRDWGTGVCPVSRRILLRVICRLSKFPGAGQGHAVMEQLVNAPLREITSRKQSPYCAERLYNFTESSYDLAYFSPELLSNALSTVPEALEAVTMTVIEGYSRPFSDEQATIQWARLRGAAYTMLRTLVTGDMSDIAARAIGALIKAECQVATAHFDVSPSDSSFTIFCDAVVGEDTVNAGVYIMLIKAHLDEIAKRKGDFQGANKCISLLQDVARDVLQLITLPSPEASNSVDPRPTTMEAWFLSMTSLLALSNTRLGMTSAGAVEEIVATSCTAAMSVIFMKDIRSLNEEPGLSLDGAQTSSIILFMTVGMPSILASLSKGGATPLLQVSCEGQSTQYDGSIAVGVFVACLLRGVSGALPPWCVEDTPELFKAIYFAMGKDSDGFIHILNLAVHLTAASPTGCIQVGDRIGGKYVDCSPSHLNQFISKARDVCVKNDWKRFKVILKTLCGGKKKDSGFSLKPQLTNFDCDRL
ncbi:hypothetical protein THAOC_21717 [Thalassiosira oceanica]|uniref:Uncharacterized protein n=1 Tax=Thalassiosira oceanica TaxID=159749 RepID=K0S0K6_THAOC|nr:hypothetical protein THAOC_21717 [Thalassiosira oceanica]|eukprot:EJK58179.1 hypothetical protein THAOC_21717 [Thalassiosira oceanica]